MKKEIDMFLTSMEKIEQRRRLLLTDAGAMDARIKEIGRVFSLMADVRQHGDQAKMNILAQCLTAFKVENAGGKTVKEILLSSGEALREKMEIVHPHLRREHARLRRDRQIVRRRVLALGKVVESYVFRPGAVE